MNKFLAHILILLAALCFIGCDTSPDYENQFDDICSEPRPEVCTREFKPVCGYKSDEASKTYSNGCTACSGKDIIGYNYGECK